MKWQWINISILLVIVSISALTACSTTKVPTKERAITDMRDSIDAGLAANREMHDNNKPPANVTDALMPSLSVKAPTPATTNAQRFDVSVSDVPARSFFMGLVDGTSYNMVVDPSVKGTISLNLKNVTIPEVMDAVRDAYGYEYKYTKFGYRVYSSAIQTQIFAVNYLNVRRSGASQTEVSSGISSDINSDEDEDGESTSSGTAGATSLVPSTGAITTGGVPGETIPATLPLQPGTGSSGTSNTSVSTQTSSDFWGTLRKSLHAIIGKENGRSVVVNPQAGVVLVRATPAELREVAEYLDKIQNSMDRQVLIEAKVLEVVLSKGFQQGINWRLLTLQQQGNRDLKNAGFKAFGVPTADEVDTDEDANDFNIFTGGISGRGFDGTIKLLSTQGDVQVLSSPRIATVNNQKALIKVGQDEFFVTNVSTSTTTGTATNTAEDVELTPFFSGIALDITPQINSSGDVTLHVHPTVVTVTDQNKTIELSGDDTLKLPLALSTVRETDSIVHARNGQVVVIGGLMSNLYEDENGMTPGFGELPGIGNLFRDTARAQKKRELVILLKPIVINEKTATEQLEESQKAFNDINTQANNQAKPVSIARWFDKVP